MWWQGLLEGLGNLVAGLGRNVSRFYAETWVGTTRKLFFLNPILPNNLDTDGSGGADLRIWIVPTVAIPPDGLTITFQRLGSGVPGVSVLLYIGVDDGIYPVGTPPARMQFAFFGFEGQSGKLAPQELKLLFRQHTAASSADLTAQLTMVNAQGPVAIRGGLMTSPVALEPATGIPFGGSLIRTGDPASAIDLIAARLSVGLPSGGTVNITTPLEVSVNMATAGTTVEYAAPEVLVLSTDVDVRAEVSQRLRFSTARMPRRLDVSLSSSEAVVHPDSPLAADLRGIGLPLPSPFTSATAQLAIPALPLRIAWGPAPVLLDVGLKPGSPGELALSLNAQLLAGTHTIESLKQPPQPRQALVAEYIEQKELWAAVNALRSVRVTMQHAGTATAAAATVTLVDPLPDGSAPLPERSVRAAAWKANRLTADIRASELASDQPGGKAGTLSGTIDIDAQSATMEITGRLRHLRALYDDGAARNEAWTAATPPTLSLSYENTDRLRFTLVPDAALALTADRRAVGAGGGVGGFARFFARLLLNAPIRGHYGLAPRQPAIQGAVAAGSTATVHRDAANTAFPPELKGMLLRYESGANQTETRTITAARTGILETVAFEFTPSEGDTFVVVATDLLVQASDKLALPSTRRGVSATVSAGRAREQRLATRIHPQLIQQTSRVWIPLVSPPGPDEKDAVAARIEGVLNVAVPPPVGPAQGPLAADIELDPARPRRSLRYAENRRWILPEAVREALAAGMPSDLRPVPRVRALLADAPDSVSIRQNVTSVASTSYSLARSGGGGQGWLWALTEQQRSDESMTGIGVVSVNFIALPQRLGLTLAENLPDVSRHTPPRDVMWVPSAGWRPPSSQAIDVSGDLRVERVVYASFWPGRTIRSGGTAQSSYPTRDEDQWDLTTATFAHLHDAGVGDQRLTLWTLDSTDWDDPDRKGGIGIEATGLSADLDMDRYRALLPPSMRSYFSIPWIKTTEIQLDAYTGAWLMSGESGGLIPSPDYEKPDEDAGFWFLRVIGKLLGFGDAYFGNTSGNINGRQRRYP